MRLLTDENFNNRILRGLQRQQPELDIIRVQETEVFRADDPAILAWAAAENRILLTHDINTITRYAYERIAAGLVMPGIIEVKRAAPIGQAIDDLLLIIGASEATEYNNRIIYVPL